MPRNTIQSLQADREHKLRCAQDLIDKAEKDGRVMTSEELAICDQATADVENINRQIKDQEEHALRAAKLADMTASLTTPRRVSTPDQPAAPAGTVTQFERVPATAKRYGALKAFKPRNGETLEQAEASAFRCGQWLRAKFFGDMKAAAWCERNNFGIYAAAGENVNTDGGFTVPEEFAQRIIDLRETYGVARQQLRVMPMGRDTMMIPRRLAGLTIGPIGENPTSAISQSNVTWNQVRLTAKKCGGLSLYSTELAEDSAISISDWLANEFAYGFSLFEDQCCFIGDGTSTYLGIRGLGNLFTTTGGVGGGQLVGAVNATATHDLFSEIDNTDITKLMSALPAYARPNAKFYCSAVCADLVFSRLAAVAGGNNTTTLRQGLGGTGGVTGLAYLGYPIVISQQCPTSTGSLNILPMFYFGDLSLSSTMGDRRDVRVFASEHRYMDTDQIGIRGVERIDIVHHDVGDTTSGNAGPIVALLGVT